MTSDDPLASYTDDQLYDIQLLLALTCGRAKSQLKQSRRVILCELNQRLGLYAMGKNYHVPAQPFNVGDLKTTK